MCVQKINQMTSYLLLHRTRNRTDKQMNLWFLVSVFLYFEGRMGQELFPSKITFEDSTFKVFGDENLGTIAAFADYDGDGSPDLFIITANEHQVSVKSKSQNSNEWYSPTTEPIVHWPNNTIIGVTPSDFTGDQITDLLVLVLTDENDPDSIAAYIHIGNEKLEFGEPMLVSDQLLNQPLVADYDYNMVADVFGATKNGDLKFWVFNGEDGFDEHLVKEAENEVTPIAYAFVDLNSDMNADLFIASDNGLGIVYEVWNVTGQNTWQLQDSHSLAHMAHIGLSSFVDIDADGYLDQVVPICEDETCVPSGIKYYSGKLQMWADMTISNLGHWHFPPPSDIPAWRRITAGFQLRSGDFDLDSYADFTCIMRKGSNKTNEVVILLNNGGGELTLDRVPDIAAGNTSPFVAAFADMSMTAHMNVIVGTESEDGNLYHMMTNTFSPDANFIKVEVVRRTCATDCPLSHVSNQPGPVTKYVTTTPSGEKQQLRAALLSQSAYLALQLPYVIMGLGQNPNFVDVVSVSIPNKCCDITVPRTSTWLSLIPNSQLVVYPKILDDPNSWESSLIIHPSQSVLLTGVVLIGTCCFIGLIAGLLHLLERREDDKQKRQEAHKFHFDAM